jgi:hypothetical protein
MGLLHHDKKVGGLPEAASYVPHPDDAALPQWHSALAEMPCEHRRCFDVQ